MGSSVNIALPAIGREFAFDAILLNWVATSFLLSAAMFAVPFGRFADIHGRKKVFLYGMMIYTASSLLCALAPTGGSFLIFRFLQGLGSAMEYATGMAILTAVFPPGERGRAMGIAVASVYIGLSVGPFAGGVLTQYIGWRSIFLANALMGAGVMVLTMWRMKGEWAGARDESFDLRGSVIYSLTLVGFMYGFSQVPSIIGFGFIVLGIIGAVAFFEWEFKVEHPVLELRLFIHNRVFALSNLAALIHYCSTFGSTFLMSLYLQYIKGHTPQEAGLIIMVMPVVMALFSPIAGRLSDRIEPRLVASAGMAITALGLFLMTGLDVDTPTVSILVYLILVGSGFAFFTSPNTNAIMSSVEKKFYGTSSATMATMRLVGQMYSMGILMLVFALYIGRVQITPEYYPHFLMSLKIGYTLFSALCLLGLFASLARGKTR
jgi:EmrB/QacA subfamily drug resistance transporter